MSAWRIRLAVLLLVLATPVAIELIIAAVRSTFSPARVVLQVLGLAILLALARGAERLARRTQIYSLMLIPLVLIGLLNMGIGAILLTGGDDGSGGLDLGVAGGLTLGGGLFVFGLSLSLVYLDMRSVHIAPFPSGPAADAGYRPVDETLTPEEHLTVHEYRHSPQDVSELILLCRPELNVEGLHYVQVCARDGILLSADILNHPLLARYFGDTGKDQRRNVYINVGKQVGWLINGLNDFLADAEGGVLIRTVLDVERGAVYYCRIDENKYLIGVTLDQNGVHVADSATRLLADRIRGYYSLPPLQQPNV
ncbi:hypothetical protein AAH991_12940 [Microbispora sp. ZYX-F-249]|uniref:Uncharacterized protein n=1 Tax=Microbispora maris TaxID=3144104 RepID=A0ABV0AMV9_9ACTN